MTAEEPKLIVVDASIALKWQFEDEEFGLQAKTIRNDFLGRGVSRLVAPTIFSYELINGTITALKRGRISQEDASTGLLNLLLVPVELHPPPLERTFALALEHRLSAYDSSYVSLAELLGAELWTADRLLYNTVTPSLPWVRWIGDYPA